MHIRFLIEGNDLYFPYDTKHPFDDYIKIEYRDVSHLPKKGDYIEFDREVLIEKFSELVADGICKGGILRVIAIWHMYDSDYVEILLNNEDE